MVLLPAVWLLLSCLSQDQDVIRLKDGMTRSGRIALETEKEILLETFIKGSKGEILGSGKVTIDRDQIASIERASGEASGKAADRSKAFSERALRRAEGLAKLRLEPADIDGGSRGSRISSSHFELLSSCDPMFVKDMALLLQDIFQAYSKYFKVLRNAERRVKIYIWADRGEYDRFQQRSRGGVIPNVGYYNAKDNYIVVFNMIQKDEERRIRAEILRLEKEIEAFKSNILAEKGRVDKIAREIRDAIVTRAFEIRNSIRKDSEGSKEARLREADQWEKEQQGRLKAKEGDLQRELESYRKKAEDVIAQNRKVMGENQKILAFQNREMYEVLFHESFHAFAANHLWEGSTQREFPRWLHEGMATYFEMSVVEGGELLHGTPHPAFVNLLRTSALIRLEDVLRGGAEMFAVSHISEVKRSSTYYAQSWLLAHYLSTRATAAQIEAYVNDILAGNDLLRTFERLVGGKSTLLVEKELQAHLNSLK